MSAYILPLLAASLAAALVELLAPKGDGGRIAAHVRMIAGLYLLVALLNPLREGLDLLRSAAEGDLTARLEGSVTAYTPEDYEAFFRASLSALGKDETQAQVTSALESVFGIPSDACAVEAVCESDGETLILREVRIGLKGKYALKNPHPIEKYFADALGCPCYVTVISS